MCLVHLGPTKLASPPCPFWWEEVNALTSFHWHGKLISRENPTTLNSRSISMSIYFWSYLFLRYYFWVHNLMSCYDLRVQNVGNLRVHTKWLKKCVKEKCFHNISKQNISIQTRDVTLGKHPCNLSIVIWDSGSLTFKKKGILSHFLQFWVLFQWSIT